MRGLLLTIKVGRGCESPRRSDLQAWIAQARCVLQVYTYSRGVQSARAKGHDSATAGFQLTTNLLPETLVACLLRPTVYRSSAERLRSQGTARGRLKEAFALATFQVFLGFLVPPSLEPSRRCTMCTSEALLWAFYQCIQRGSRGYKRQSNRRRLFPPVQLKGPPC